MNSFQPEWLPLLQHALGCDEYGRSSTPLRDEGDGCFGYYRNRFVTGPTERDGQHCEAMVQARLMTRHAGSELTGGNACYVVTRAGVQAMQERSPRPPKVSPGRRRYLEWLKTADATGMTFGQWLKHGRGA